MTFTSCWILEYEGPDRPPRKDTGFDAPAIAGTHDLPALKHTHYWTAYVQTWAERHGLELDWVTYGWFEVCCTPDQLRDFLRTNCQSDSPKFAPLMDRIDDTKRYILGAEEF